MLLRWGPACGEDQQEKSKNIIYSRSRQLVLPGKLRSVLTFHSPLFRFLGGSLVVMSSTKSTHKMIYYFGKTRTDGTGVSKQILGGKGANLADMTSIGLPVPPGFTITTEVCGEYYKAGQKIPAGLIRR